MDNVLLLMILRALVITALLTAAYVPVLMVLRHRRRRGKSIPTVNVIDFKEFDPLTIESTKSYPDTPEGNKKAEAAFFDLVQPHLLAHERANDENMDIHLDNGYYETGYGAIVITHSTG